MKKWVYIGLTFLLFSISAIAQTEVKPGNRQDTIIRKEQYIVRDVPDNRRLITRNITPKAGEWSFEGSFGMAFGDQTTINIQPQVRYSQNAYFSLGGGVSYSHYYHSHNKEKLNYLGLNVFARVTPFPYLALQVQPEVLERWGKINGKKVSGKIVPTFLAGGGFFIPVGPGSINLMFFYDVIQNKYTPYGDGLYYTIGYSFSFR